jgi:hypothetical protein
MARDSGATTVRRAARTLATRTAPDLHADRAGPLGVPSAGMTCAGMTRADTTSAGAVVGRETTGTVIGPRTAAAGSVRLLMT